MFLINWYFIYEWNLTTSNGSFNQGVNVQVPLLIVSLFTLCSNHAAQEANESN